MPALLFLVLGMLAGSEGPGGMAFDDPWLAQSLGVVALTCILFAGGLETHWPAVRPVLWPAGALSTFGVALTALLVGWFATVVLGFSWLQGLLLGAILSSTDAAAVFRVLRSRSMARKGRLKPSSSWNRAVMTPWRSSSLWGSPALWSNRTHSSWTWCRCSASTWHWGQPWAMAWGGAWSPSSTWYALNTRASIPS